MLLVIITVLALLRAHSAPTSLINGDILMTHTHRELVDGIHTLEKTSIDHVWKLPDGRFVWTDETDNLGDCYVYTMFEDAVSAMTVYTWFVLEGLSERLKHETLDVTFKKSDGTIRTMHCTAMPGAFPLRETTERTTVPNPDVQVVVDLDKNAIRSFRRDSVIKFSART
jgi:hypothetical protein